MSRYAPPDPSLQPRPNRDRSLPQMETFAQTSDKDVSDRSFIQYDATGKVIRTTSEDDISRVEDKKAGDFYPGV